MSKAVTYRPDIDALRAIAVLSVVIFHFDKAWLPGGFLGVDIFFVISGFLITLILHREMRQRVFSFKTFYVRRMKRILPVFFIVLLVVVLMGALLFTPDDFSLLGKTALASILFSANLYFSRGQGYFDPAQDEKPLLHIWSLSVEEQFYFVFPLLLMLVVRRSWRTQILFLTGLIVLSLLSAYLPNGGLDKYYLPHLRAFEMLVGSLLAVLVQWQMAVNGQLQGERFAAVSSMTALVVLLGCLFFYHPDMPYFPGWAGLLPCIAVAVLIYFNSFEHRFRRLFEWKWVVGVGLVSYSLYLWHWPVLAFARYIHGQEHLPKSWLLPLFLVMVVATLATYFGVEKPMKVWRPSFGRSAIGFYILPSACLVAAWFGLQHSPLIRGYQQAGLARDHSSCHNKIDKRCIWGDDKRKPDVLMLGDSHADQYKTFIDYIGKKEGWSATLVSADTCAFVTGYNAKVFHSNKSCQTVYEYAEKHMQDYPVVMLAMRWSNQVDSDKRSIGYDEQFFEKFDKMLASLSQQKKAVYVFTDNPNIQYAGLRAYKLERTLPITVALRLADSKTAEGNDRMQAIAARYTNVHVVDAKAFLPDNFRFDSKPAYADLDHMSPFGAEMLAKQYVAEQKLRVD